MKTQGMDKENATYAALKESVLRGDSKVTFKIIFKDSAILEPLNLASKQCASVLEWLGLHQNSQDLESPEFVLSNVTAFHPDFRFDQTNRELLHLNHPSRVWLKWEATIFDPSDYPIEHKFFMSYAEARGHDLWAFGSYDLRKMALFATSAMCLYEFGKLREAVDSKWGIENSTIRSNDEIPTAVWQHLYWFTRFYRAWQRIGDFPGGNSLQTQKASNAARLWKQAAWNFFCDLRKTDPKVKVKTVALDFVEKYPPRGVNFTDVHKWLQKRKRLFLGTPTPQRTK
jgi:hypothetical protein